MFPGKRREMRVLGNDGKREILMIVGSAEGFGMIILKNKITYEKELE